MSRHRHNTPILLLIGLALIALIVWERLAVRPAEVQKDVKEVKEALEEEAETTQSVQEISWLDIVHRLERVEEQTIRIEKLLLEITSKPEFGER